MMFDKLLSVANKYDEAVAAFKRPGEAPGDRAAEKPLQEEAARRERHLERIREPAADGLVDGSHPNDLGFQWMAESLATRLRHLLAIS